MALSLQSHKDEPTVLEAVHMLKDEIIGLQSTIEKARGLPESLVTKLKLAGVFRMTMPKAWGGLEFNPMQQLEVIEALAEYDASVAWNVMIGADSGMYSGFIDQTVAKDMFKDIDSITASALTATGEAHRKDGGFTVKGRWPFNSGCQNAEWFLFGCRVFENGEQCFMEDGTPQTIQCFVRAKNVTIHDTWYTTGLRGSGSHEVSVSGCFVPEAQTFTYQNIRCYRDTPLYQFPYNILLNFASIPLGVTQRALDEFIKSGQRPSRLTLVNGSLQERRQLRDEAFSQDAVGRCATSLRATRAYVYDVTSEIWECIEQQRQMPPELFAQFQMLCIHSYQTCTDSVERLYKARGGTAVQEGDPVGRCLRDLQTMNQHVLNSLRSYTMGGRVLLGLPPETLLL